MRAASIKGKWLLHFTTISVARPCRQICCRPLKVASSFLLLLSLDALEQFLKVFRNSHGVLNCVSCQTTPALLRGRTNEKAVLAALRSGAARGSRACRALWSWSRPWENFACLREWGSRAAGWNWVGLQWSGIVWDPQYKSRTRCCKEIRP